MKSFGKDVYELINRANRKEAE